MIDSKKAELLVPVFIVVILLAIFLLSRSPVVELEGPITGQISSVISESGTYLIHTKLNEDECYWIRPAHNGTHYIVEINRYKSKDKNCYGTLEDKVEVVAEHPVNIQTNSCICGAQACKAIAEMDNVRLNLKFEKCNM